MSPLFWLASYPKSGSTWVRLLLHAYRYGACDINANLGVTEYDCEPWRYHAIAPRPITDMSPQHVLFLRHAVLLMIGCNPRMRPVVVKTHQANMTVGSVDMVPKELTAGAVYLVRDPRDVSSSFSRHTGLSVDEAITAMAAPATILQNDGTGVASWLGSWSRHVASWDKAGVVRVRFEDMVADPAGQFIRILDALHLKVDTRKVRRAVRLCALDNLRRQETRHGFIERRKQTRFFGAGRGWERELTDRQARRIEADHGDVMRDLGYLS